MVKDTETQFKYVTCEKLIRLTHKNSALGFEPKICEVEELESKYMLKVSYETAYSTSFYFCYVENDYEVKLREDKIDEETTKMLRADLLNDKEHGKEYEADLREFMHSKVDKYIEDLKKEAE